MKVFFILVISLLTLGAVFALYRMYTAQPAEELTVDESLMLETVRNAYGEKILSESIADSNGDKVLTIKLRDHQIAETNINLSSLAKKHRDEGLSLPVIKMMLP